PPLRRLHSALHITLTSLSLLPSHPPLPPRDLPSFPTRRSSDLQRGYTAAKFSFNSGDGRCPTCGGSGFEHVEMQFLSDVYLRCRSEEHTSELQSRGHLVCRRLLEKKKQPTRASPFDRALLSFSR